MKGRKQYDYERYDRRTAAQDDWYLQRRREIVAANNALQKKAGSTGIEISSPDDAHEQQADAIAKDVVNGNEINRGLITPVSNSVQTKSEAKPLNTSSEFSDKLNNAKSSGEPLDGSLRTEMESKMGADFSGVKIHTDSSAHALSREINAQAFTEGQNIFFNQGKYNPASSDGQELIAHELVHTVQQGDGMSRKVMRKPEDPQTKKEFRHLSPAREGYPVSDGIKLMPNTTADATEEYTLKATDQLSITYDTAEDDGWYFAYLGGSNYSVSGYIRKKEVKYGREQEVYKVSFWGENFDLQYVGAPILGYDSIYQLWYKGSNYRQITDMSEVPVEGYNQLGMGKVADEVQSVLTDSYVPAKNDEDSMNPSEVADFKDTLLKDKSRGLPLIARFSAPKKGVPISNTISSVILKSSDGTDFVIKAEQYVANIDPKHQYLVFRIHVIYDGKDYSKEVTDTDLLQPGYAFFVFAAKENQKLPDLTQPKNKEDFPASLPSATFSAEENAYQMFIDSDGDQHKDIFLTLKPRKIRLSEGPDDKNNYMCVIAERVDTGEKTETNTLWWLTDDEASSLGVSFYNRTDGKIDTTYKLYDLNAVGTTKSYGYFQLSPPEVKNNRLEYKGKMADKDFTFNLNAQNTQTYDTFIAGDSGKYAGKFYFDLALGLYQDVFRFIFEYDTENSSLLTIFSANGKKLTQSEKVRIDIPVPSSFNVLKSENPGDKKNIGCFIDFNGDKKEDLVIYDRLAVTYSNDPASANVTGESEISDKQRYHYINIVTPSKGEEKDKSSFIVFKIDPSTFTDYNKITNLEDLNKYAEFSLASLFKKTENEDDFFAEMEGVLVSIELAKAKLLKEGKIQQDTYTSWQKLALTVHILYPTIAKKGSDPTLEKDYQEELDTFWMDLAQEEVKKGTKAFMSSERYKVAVGDRNDPVAYFKPFFVYGAFYSDYLHDIIVELGDESEEGTQLKNFAEAQSEKMHQLLELKDKNATKAKAFHYPLNVETPGKQKIQYVPLELYYWKEGSSWYVKDITNPLDPQQKSYAASEGEKVPPPELFEQLNYTGKYVEGLMYVEVKGRTDLYKIKTEEKTSASQYLAYVGLALLAIGIALTGVGLFLEAGTAAAIGVGTAASIAFAGAELAFGGSSVLSIYDNYVNGTLTIGNFLFDASMIVASCLGAAQSVFGNALKTAKTTGKVYTGFVGQIIKTADKYIIPLTKASHAANTTVLLEISVEGLQQINEIAERTPDSPERDKAIYFHIAMLAGMGLIHAKFSGPAIKDIKGGQSIFKFTDKLGAESIVSVSENLKTHLDDLVRQGENTTVQRLFAKTSDAYQLERLVTLSGDIRMVDRMLLKCADGNQLELLLIKIESAPLLDRILGKCLNGDQVERLLDNVKDAQLLDRLLGKCKDGNQLERLLVKVPDAGQLERILNLTNNTDRLEILLTKVATPREAEDMLTWAKKDLTNMSSNKQKAYSTYESAKAFIIKKGIFGTILESIGQETVEKYAQSKGYTVMRNVRLHVIDAQGKIIGGSLREVDNVLIGPERIEEVVNTKINPDQIAGSFKNDDIPTFNYLMNIPLKQPQLESYLTVNRITGGSINNAKNAASPVVVFELNGKDIKLNITEFRNTYMKGITDPGKDIKLMGLSASPGKTPYLSVPYTTDQLADIGAEAIMTVKK